MKDISAHVGWMSAERPLRDFMGVMNMPAGNRKIRRHLRTDQTIENRTSKPFVVCTSEQDLHIESKRCCPGGGGDASFERRWARTSRGTPDRHDATTEDGAAKVIPLLPPSVRQSDRQICTRIDVHVLKPLLEGGQTVIFNITISNKNLT